MRNKSVHFVLIVLIIATHTISNKLFAQSDDISKIGVYTWHDAVPLTPCDIIGNVLTSGTTAVALNPVLSLSGQKFLLFKVNSDGSALIQVLDYTKPVIVAPNRINRVVNALKSSSTASPPATGRIYNVDPEFYRYNFLGDPTAYSALSVADANSRSYGVNQRYFKVGINLVEQCARKESRIGSSLAAGVINFPFKYRFQKNNEDFSGAFNFGAGLGVTLPHKVWRKYTHSIISGYSFSNVVLDSSNANKHQDKLASTNNFSAFSFSIGYLIQYQRVQGGIFLGWDRISKINENQFSWQYQGKPWVSIGFGVAIFSNQNEKPQDDKKSQTDN